MKKEKMLKVLVKEPGKDCEVREIENTLEAKQEIVDGLIEVVNFDDVLIICNEEGKILGLEPNLIFPYDYIVGTVIVIGNDYYNCGFRSLTDHEIEEYSRILNRHNLYIKGEE